MQEMIDNFSFDTISKSVAIFNPVKPLWLNGTYIREKSSEQLLTLLVVPFMLARGWSYSNQDSNLLKLIDETKIRSRTLVELLDMMDYYFKNDIEYNQEAAKKLLTIEKAKHLEIMMSRLSHVENFSREHTEIAIKGYATESGSKLGDVAQPLRLAVTGKTVSPGLFEIMEILGKEKVINRIDKALLYIQNNMR